MASKYIAQIEKACHHCGQITLKPMYCGNACKVASYKARNPDRVVANRERERLTGPSPLLIERMVYRRWATRIVTGYAERINRLRDRISRKASHSASACRVCSAPVGYAGNGRVRLYCSDQCERLSEAAQRNRRINRAQRRAKRIGVMVERIDPLVVLERDDWRCHVCGGDAPKEARGTMRWDAPEVDHIVPLSRGGSHTYANVACAHRRCNIIKGDGLINGEADARPERRWVHGVPA
jgi:5-methylcytosine-specific restriction endonuclease McrA